MGRNHDVVLHAPGILSPFAASCTRTEIILELTAFHCSPLRHQAVAIDSLNNIPTPSPRREGSQLAGKARPECRKTGFPTAQMSFSNYFASCSPTISKILYFSNSSTTQSSFLFTLQHQYSYDRCACHLHLQQGNEHPTTQRKGKVIYSSSSSSLKKFEFKAGRIKGNPRLVG